MAKIEAITWSKDSTTQFINVSASVGVGHGAVNNKNDVLVVQALFKYISPALRGGHFPTGIPDSECPEPTGTFDKATARLIKKFQVAHRDKLLQDGIIHPARGGKFEWGYHKIWTIVYLNGQADSATLGENSPIQALVKRFPQVANALNQLIDL